MLGSAHKGLNLEIVLGLLIFPKPEAEKDVSHGWEQNEESNYWIRWPMSLCLALSILFHLNPGITLWGLNCEHPFLLKDEETEAQAGKVSGPRPQTARKSQHQGLTPKRQGEL